MKQSKNQTIPLVVCLSFALVSTGANSSNTFKQKVLQKNQECLAEKHLDKKEKCLADMRQMMIQNNRDKQKEMRGVIKSNDEFNAAVKRRDKSYEDARGQNPRW